MKFLCVPCDEQMEFEERSIPGDGTLAAAFRCPACDHVMAMLTNPMETRLVSSLGVSIGGTQVPEQPLEGVRRAVAGGTSDLLEEPLAAGPGTGVRWSVDAVERLAAVPRFVRGMVKKIYTEYAKENGIDEITPAVMDRARSDLGLEEM
jgi:hypothetical protein